MINPMDVAKAYASAHRSKRLRAELRRSATVTDAIYDAGYNSGGRFYADTDKVLGMNVPSAPLAKRKLMATVSSTGNPRVAREESACTATMSPHNMRKL